MNKELKVHFGKKQILNECTNEESRMAIIVHIKYIIYSIWFLIFKNNTMNAMNAMLFLIKSSPCQRRYFQFYWIVFSKQARH